ncbi:MAG: hypothetical protein PHG66_03745 [Candidatus Colwellbacteria bacterium]|nr:hypothetical protein [Candidatus Colwellbacteria bacterium]
MSFSYFHLGDDRYAVSVVPPKGSSVYSSKIIERDNPKAEITESEMENAIASVIWKLFDEERMFFSKRLDVSEMDVLMADVRVLFVKLDGSVVVNPVGFTAKKIEIGLAETLITRDLSESMKEGAPKTGEIVLTMEPAASCAWLIQKDSKHKDFIFASVSHDRTFLYRSEEGERISYISDFGWGSDDIVNDVMSGFGIDDVNAREMVRRYSRSDMSSDMVKNLRSIVSKPFSGFMKGVTAATHNVKMRRPIVHVMSDDLAELDPKSINWGEPSLKLNFLPAIDRSEIAFHELAAADVENAFNKIARRRMKWLMCHK